MLCVSNVLGGSDRRWAAKLSRRVALDAHLDQFHQLLQLARSAEQQHRHLTLGASAIAQHDLQVANLGSEEQSASKQAGWLTDSPSRCVPHWSVLASDGPAPRWNGAFVHVPSSA